MKTRVFILIVAGAMMFVLESCTKEQNGAELITPKQLKIKQGYKAYLVTDKEGQTSLLIENENSNAKLKKPSEIWKCTCNLSNSCVLISEEGSNTALCVGNCLCGFYPVPIPKDDEFKDQAFTSKKLLIDNTKS